MKLLREFHHPWRENWIFCPEGAMRGKGQEVTNEKSGCWDILLRIQVFGQKENTIIPVSFVFPMTVRFLG